MRPFANGSGVLGRRSPAPLRRCCGGLRAGGGRAGSRIRRAGGKGEESVVCRRVSGGLCAHWGVSGREGINLRTRWRSPVRVRPGSGLAPRATPDSPAPALEHCPVSNLEPVCTTACMVLIAGSGISLMFDISVKIFASPSLQAGLGERVGSAALLCMGVKLSSVIAAFCSILLLLG